MKVTFRPVYTDVFSKRPAFISLRFQIDPLWIRYSTSAAVMIVFIVSVSKAPVTRIRFQIVPFSFCCDFKSIHFRFGIQLVPLSWSSSSSLCLRPRLHGYVFKSFRFHIAFSNRSTLDCLFKCLRFHDRFHRFRVNRSWNRNMKTYTCNRGPNKRRKHEGTVAFFQWKYISVIEALDFAFGGILR